MNHRRRRRTIHHPHPCALSAALNPSSPLLMPPRHGYFAACPQREYLPLFWSDAQLEQLAGTELAERVQADRCARSGARALKESQLHRAALLLGGSCSRPVRAVARPPSLLLNPMTPGPTIAGRRRGRTLRSTWRRWRAATPAACGQRR